MRITYEPEANTVPIYNMSIGDFGIVTEFEEQEKLDTIPIIGRIFFRTQEAFVDLATGHRFDIDVFFPKYPNWQKRRVRILPRGTTITI